jgi:hypothetical protein
MDHVPAHGEVNVKNVMLAPNDLNIFVDHLHIVTVRDILNKASLEFVTVRLLYDLSLY